MATSQTCSFTLQAGMRDNADYDQLHVNVWSHKNWEQHSYFIVKSVLMDGKICWKNTCLQAIQDVDEFFHWNGFGEITSLAHQWIVCTNWVPLNTKEDILKNSEKPNKLWKSMGTVNCLITSILQNIFFYVQVRKKQIQVWNDIKDEWWQFSFLGELSF